MSGGSWEYLGFRIMEAANRLLDEKCKTRKAFGKHMLLIAEAIHDIEWVDSGDKGRGDDIDSIMKCITPQEVLNCRIEDAKNTITELQNVIDKLNTRD